MCTTEFRFEGYNSPMLTLMIAEDMNARILDFFLNITTRCVESNGMHRVYLTGKGSSLAFVMSNYTDCFIVNECMKLNGIWKYMWNCSGAIIVGIRVNIFSLHVCHREWGNELTVTGGASQILFWKITNCQWSRHRGIRVHEDRPLALMFGDMRPEYNSTR